MNYDLRKSSLEEIAEMLSDEAREYICLRYTVLLRVIICITSHYILYLVSSSIKQYNI